MLSEIRQRVYDHISKYGKPPKHLELSAEERIALIEECMVGGEWSFKEDDEETIDNISVKIV